MAGTYRCTVNSFQPKRVEKTHVHHHHEEDDKSSKVIKLKLDMDAIGEMIETQNTYKYFPQSTKNTSRPVTARVGKAGGREM